MMDPNGSKGAIIVYCVNILRAKQDPQKTFNQTFAYQTAMMTQSIMSIIWYKKVILLNLHNYSQRHVLSMICLENSLSILRR